MPTTETTAPPDSPAGVVGDVPCIRCGYNLRSLEASAACPECGTPIVRTLHSHLRHSDPDWLRKLHNAAGRVCAATAGALLIILLVVGHEDRATDYSLAVMGCGAVMSVLVWVLGALAMASVEPADREPAVHRRPRGWLASRTLLILLLPFALAAVVGLASWGRHIEFLLLGLFVALWLGPLALAARVRNLFRRLSAEGLAKQARAVCVLQGTLMLAAAVVALVPVVRAAWSGGPISWIPSSRAENALVEGLVEALPAPSLWLFFLLLALRRRLREALDDAGAPLAPEAAAEPALPRWERNLLSSFAPAVAVGLLVLNLWPFERQVVPCFYVYEDGSLPVETIRGWPRVYQTSEPRPPARAWQVDVPLLAVDLLAGGLLVAMTAATVGDYVDCRSRRIGGEAVSSEL